MKSDVNVHNINIRKRANCDKCWLKWAPYSKFGYHNFKWLTPGGTMSAWEGAEQWVKEHSLLNLKKKKKKIWIGLNSICSQISGWRLGGYSLLFSKVPLEQMNKKWKYIFSQYKEALFICFWWCSQAVYCHPAYLTSMQSTSWEMLGWT